MGSIPGQGMKSCVTRGVTENKKKHLLWGRVHALQADCPALVLALLLTSWSACGGGLGFLICRMGTVGVPAS